MEDLVVKLREESLLKRRIPKVRNILLIRKLSVEVTKRILDCYVISTLIYGSECWTISAQLEARLNAAEMWFYRRMFRISYKEHISNIEVLHRANTGKRILKTIRKRQL